MPAQPIIHTVSVCRWCGGPFYLAHARPPQWLCLTPACADRQVRAAIPRLTPPNYDERTGDEAPSPWLFLPLPLNIDLAESPWKRTLLAGAAGCAKSFGARWMAYRECLARPGIRVLLMRTTFDSLKKNHTQFMAAEAQALQMFGHGVVRFVSGQYQSCSFENGSVILMGYCATDADVQKHLGNDLDLIIMEEAVLFPPKAIVEIPPRDRASPTARALGATDGKTWLLSNPGGQAMLTLSEFYIHKNPDENEYPMYNPSYHGYIHGDLRDNPYLEAAYAEKNLSGLSAARYRQLRHGDWSIYAGQFFDDFNAAEHVRALVGVA